MKIKKMEQFVAIDYKWFELCGSAGLTHKDLFVLGIIKSLQGTKHGCIASDNYFEELLHTTNIDRSIKRLAETGLITITKIKGVGQSTNRRAITINEDVISEYQIDVCLDEADIKIEVSQHQNDVKPASKVTEASIKSDENNEPKAGLSMGVGTANIYKYISNNISNTDNKNFPPIGEDDIVFNLYKDIFSNIRVDITKDNLDAMISKISDRLGLNIIDIYNDGNFSPVYICMSKLIPTMENRLWGFHMDYISKTVVNEVINAYAA